MSGYWITAGQLRAKLIPFGASLQELYFDPAPHSLVLGLRDEADYTNHGAHLGANAGRYANRIAKGRFSLNGRAYQLDCNEGGKHCLHGGSQGTGVCSWRVSHHDKDEVTFTLNEPDGWMGFPGALSATLTYQVTSDNRLTLSFDAICTEDSLINFAHHSYFNLADEADISNHHLTIHASHYLPVDDDNIPTGIIADVTGTIFDLQRQRFVGADQFDHNFCVSGKGDTLREVAQLSSAATGITMRVASDQPGLQCYTGDHLAISAPTCHDRPYQARAGICLEPQIWPDAPNHPSFPQAILRKGDRYHQRLEFSFAHEAER